MFKLLAAAAVERRFFKSLTDFFDLIIAKIAVRLLSCTTKVQKDLIVFTNFTGNYECNPKYICEEILRRQLPYDVVWVVWGNSGPGARFNDPSQFPTNIRLVKRYSYEFYKALLSARVIVDNGTSYVSAECPKKKGQILLNTFHGSLGIKKAPKEDGAKMSTYNRKARKSGEVADFAISNSEFEDGYYRSSTYFATTPIQRLGHARNDIFFNLDPTRTAAIRKKVYAEFNLPEDVKICLYGPTFRNDHDIRPYKVDYAELIAALERKFGGRWVVFTRFHHQSRKFTANLTFPKGVIAATEYPDIHELMLCAEVGITDYSSWICEYIHTGRPGFLYATDMAHYNDFDRDFYDPLDQMPFPLSTDTKSLIASIENFDAAKYKADCAKFLKEKGCIDDGHAAERVVDLIKGYMS